MSAVTVVLAGCVTTGAPVDVRKVDQKDPPAISATAKLEPIVLDVASVNIKRGTPIAQFQGFGHDFKTGGHLCRSAVGNAFWNSGRINMRNTEFEDIFYEEFTNARYNVVGDPKNVFAARQREQKRPSYLIGAQVTHIGIEACDLHHWWDGRPLLTQLGRGSIEVKWQVFSRLKEEVVYETTTGGFADLSQPTRDGILSIINQAFGSAAANFAADRKLLELVSAEGPRVADIRAVDDVTLRIDRQKLLDQPIASDIDRIRLGVVTLDSGAGHGSGFFISPTLVMTNQHVIRGQKFIKVRLVTGREIIGEVIRSHAERDVALVQVENAGFRPLAIRMEPVKIAEEVFVIGSPQDRALSGTVTKGIVSRFTANDYGLEDIQSDVAVHGGNSGGPLLDAKGNVVGVTYAGLVLGPGKTNAGLNVFVPIYDALQKLNLEFKDRRRAGSGS